MNTETPLYRKNPEATQLGQRILAAATELYAQYGLEWVTFRKLAGEIESTEASIYRYFHNKYQLLCYLVYRHWQSVCSELERWNRELPPGLRLPQLLMTLFPSQGEASYRDRQRSLLPIFWTWYQSRTDQDEAYSRPVLEAFVRVVDQAGLALDDQNLPTSQLAHMLCQTAGCLALFEQVPGFEASAYRELWEGLLRQGGAPMLPPVLNAVNLEALVLRRPDYASRPEERLERLVKPAELLNADSDDDHDAADDSDRLPEDFSEAVLPAAPVLHVAPAVPSPASEVSVPAEAVKASITHVMVRKRGGYNLLELQDFMALPPGEQQQLLIERRIHFISGEGQPIEMVTAIRQLFPAGLHQSN